MKYDRLIKIIRNKTMLTQEELATILGVSFATVNRWENGHYKPTLKVQRKIVKFCRENGIDIEKI